MKTLEERAAEKLDKAHELVSVALMLTESLDAMACMERALSEIREALRLSEALTWKHHQEELGARLNAIPRDA